MNANELQSILDFAVESAQLAGTLTLGYFNAGVAAELKSDQSPVTAADRAAEQFLRQRIMAAFPSHGILGEECGETPAAGGARAARWILDPIDGTQSFISGVPLYCVLIGFEVAGEMLAGVIHMPALGETVYAARGHGCRWNGRAARVSPRRTLAEARLLCVGGKFVAECGRAREYERLRTACALERGWCDGYAYALVATGRAEIALDPRMALWDTAALQPVITEAGGMLTDWSGHPTHTAPEAVATNGHLHAEVVRLIRPGQASASGE